ncbi:MAG: type II secretion system F family protein [Clostridiaceae bacterium]|nr:type II secretion system F family protein [Bacillota bacterium]NLP07318.1 type II secretion system F family protein [Clostridiaceae bacterium]HPZ04738.1 type II secretion system F family protein [Clostridiales bacterium]HQD32040.1 type II secretion system F family protein [Clostridiales bacterium]
MLAVIFLMSFASCFTLIFSVLSIAGRDDLIISSRLQSIKDSRAKNENDELDQPLISRVIRPFLDYLSKAVMRITPKEMISSLESKITKAGNPWDLVVKDWINLQAVLVIGIPVITYIALRNSGIPAGTILMLLIAEAALGFVLPGFILGKMLTARQKTILNSLPDVIDLITVIVEAGLGFDGALMKVVEKKPGPLAEEFDRVLQEIKVGRKKKDALRDMVNRLDIQDFTTFVGAIIQADQFGVGIAQVLRIQSEQIRLKRKQRAQERAMKVPVRMLIPMVVFIFPTLFVVLLGPVVIKLIEQFSGM